MNRYGEAAVLAVRFIKEGCATDPNEAWAKATKRIFPASVDMQKKGCPKGAFLGLCNEGTIDSVSPGKYTSTTQNGKYAIDAIAVLRKNRFLSSQPDMLWKKVAGNTKSANHQMDVVVALWEAGYIGA